MFLSLTTQHPPTAGFRSRPREEGEGERWMWRLSEVVHAVGRGLTGGTMQSVAGVRETSAKRPGAKTGEQLPGPRFPRVGSDLAFPP